MDILNDYEMLKIKNEDAEVVYFNFPFYMNTAKRLSCSYFHDFCGDLSEKEMRKYIMNVVNNNRKFIYTIAKNNSISNYIFIFNNDKIENDFYKYIEELLCKYKVDICIK